MFFGADQQPGAKKDWRLIKWQFFYYTFYLQGVELLLNDSRLMVHGSFRTPHENEKYVMSRQ